MPAPIYLLHVFPSFGRGGMELLSVGIINALGPEWRHGILAVDGCFDAAPLLAPETAAKLIAPPARPGTASYVWKLRRILTRERANLVATYNWGATDAILGSLLWPPSPIVHHEHGFGQDEAQNLKFRRTLARRVLLRRARQVIVISGTLERIAHEQFRVPEGKLRKIRTGVDTSRFSPDVSSNWRERLGAGPEDILFGFVGRFRPEKNLPLLLRAFAAAAVPKSILALAGDGELRPEMEGLARELGIEQRVRFLGALDDPAPFYAALDLLVLSSDTEQTPVSLLEAMASGRAALVPDVGDCAAILAAGPEARWVVPPRDCGAMAEAIRWLAGNREERLRQGACNRERILREYSRERMIREYRSVYLAAAAGPPV
jgi:glycosyltransferase involved in cell wall biosynthesis